MGSLCSFWGVTYSLQRHVIFSRESSICLEVVLSAGLGTLVLPRAAMSIICSQRLPSFALISKGTGPRNKYNKDGGISSSY